MTSRDTRWRRWFCATILTVTATVASGCFESFGDKLREHQGCVGAAQIARAKADFCMNDSSGHRRDFNSCLSAQGVPDFKIDRLDECVESEEHHRGY